MVNHSLVKHGGSKYVARKPVRRSKSKSHTPKRKATKRKSSSKRKATKKKTTKRKRSSKRKGSKTKSSKRRKLRGGSGVGYSLSLSSKVGGKSVIDRIENCKAPMDSNYNKL